MATRIQSKGGFTFVEVMVTLVILTVGIVAIFQTYFYSLNQLSYLVHRLHASSILENRLLYVERIFRAEKSLPLEMRHKETVDLGVKVLEFDEKISVAQIDEFSDIFKIDITLTWLEKDRELSLTRSTIISDFGVPIKN